MTKHSLLAALSSLVFFLIAYFVVRDGHIHEDAYILFTYSENLARTGIISYFEYGPPAEGATDFLWMVMISALYFIGISSGVAALLLNTAGIFLSNLLLLKTASRYGASDIVNVFIAAYLPVSSLALAGYSGFSVALYTALLLSLVYVTFFKQGKALLTIPVIGLIIALFRPDGALIAMISSLLVLALLDKEHLKSYFLVLLGTGVIGIIYFVWRWNYFGEILPLPLIVKGSSDRTLPGLGINLGWLLSVYYFVALAVFTIFLKHEQWKRLLVTATPICLYFCAILFAEQSQNIGARFQAPMEALLLFASVISLAYLSSNLHWNNSSAHKGGIASMIVVLIAIQLGSLQRVQGDVGYLKNSDYINYFPVLLSSAANKDTKIALTEAGRLAYWVPGSKYDLVGLNTPHTAVHGSTSKYLESLKPDLIFIHHAGTMPSLGCSSTDNFCEISNEEYIKAGVNDKTLDWLNSSNRVKSAPASVYQYITEHPHRYQIFAVRYWGQFNHVYALRIDGNITQESFIDALAASYEPTNNVSYLDALKVSRD